MADNILSLLRKAVVAIVRNDVQIASICGRSAELIVTWKGLRPGGPLPIIVYQLSGFGQTPQDGDTRNGTLTISAFADGDDSLSIAESLTQRCAEILTAPAFHAQGLDAAPLLLVDDSNDDISEEFDAGVREGSRNIERADLEIELTTYRAA